MLFNSAEWFIFLVKHALKSVIQRFKCISIVLNSQPCRFIDIYQLRILLSCLLFKATKQETFKFVVCLQIHFFSWNNCFKRLKVISHTLNIKYVNDHVNFFGVIVYSIYVRKQMCVRRKLDVFVCFLIRSFWNHFLETQTIQIVTRPN